MKNTYNTIIENLQIFFGPSAKSCCYEVGSDFFTHIEKFEFADKVITKKNGKMYFNLPQFNLEVLMQVGLKSDQVNADYNVCTICNTAFCSYRRQGLAAGRQMTVACLNE